METMYLVDKSKTTLIKLRKDVGSEWHIIDFMDYKGYRPPTRPGNQGESLMKWLKDNDFWHMREEELARYLLIS